MFNIRYEEDLDAKEAKEEVNIYSSVVSMCEFMTDNHNACIQAGRMTGKSTATARFALQSLLAGKNVQIVTLNSSLSRIMINRISELMSGLHTNTNFVTFQGKTITAYTQAAWEQYVGNSCDVLILDEVTDISYDFASLLQRLITDRVEIKILSTTFWPRP